MKYSSKAEYLDHKSIMESLQYHVAVYNELDGVITITYAMNNGLSEGLLAVNDKVVEYYRNHAKDNEEATVESRRY